MYNFDFLCIILTYLCGNLYFLCDKFDVLCHWFDFSCHKFDFLRHNFDIVVMIFTFDKLAIFKCGKDLTPVDPTYDFNKPYYT